MFFKIGVLKNFRNIHKKTPVLQLLLNKVAGLEASPLLIIKLVTNVGNLPTFSYLNQKHNVGWFLLGRFVDLIRYILY